MKSLRDIRVIPVVLIAIAGLAVLKVAGLVIDGGYVFDYQPGADKPLSWAQQTINFPGGNKSDSNDITGSVHEKPKDEAPKPEAAPEVTKQGVEMVALCGRKPTTVDTPMKKEIREKMYAEKYEAKSKSYLQEVRKAAMIEYR